jgi:hypothetical protein
MFQAYSAMPEGVDESGVIVGGYDSVNGGYGFLAILPPRKR